MVSDIMGKVIGIAIGLFVVAILLPLALVELAGTETDVNASGIESSVQTMLYILLPVLAAIAIAMYFLPRMKGGD